MKKNKSKILIISLAIAVALAAGIVGITKQESKTAEASYDSTHVVMAWMNGLTCRVWSAAPQSLWNDLWMRATNTQASNCHTTAIANFELFTSNGVDLAQYGDFSYSIGADRANLYVGQKVTLYIQYIDGTTEVREFYFDNSGSIHFHLDKAALISVVTQARADAGDDTVDRGAYSPKTGRY